MAKAKTYFFCSECGYESAKWTGQCPSCKSWNTMVEAPQASSRETRGASAAVSLEKPVRLSEIKTGGDERIRTGIEEFDRVLGGGIVRGSLTLIGGDPGIGKSTLLLQVLRTLADMDIDVLYISGEESKAQIKLRADRLGDFKKDMTLYCETNLEAVIDVIRDAKPQVAVVDSIQTMYSGNIDSAPGSVSQVREATSLLMRAAKETGCSIFIVGHVTKEGVIAGPRMLEHMVDASLYFEGDRFASYRILRAVKNRFGATNEAGIFEMRNEGLVQVANPSEYLITGRPEDSPGSVITCSMEGTRPMMIEIQALLARTNYSYPKRTAAGMDFSRINILSAVMENRMGLQLDKFDIYINIAGGLRLREPSMDLAIVAAILSGYKNVPVSGQTVVLGEVGLAGEVRAVNMIEQRISEAKKLGFLNCIIPKSNVKTASKIKGIEITGVSSVKELYNKL